VTANAYVEGIEAKAERNRALVEMASLRGTETVLERIEAVSLDGLMQQAWPEHRFVVEKIIPRREPTLLGGHGGMGKSALALTIGAHVVCGRKWGPFATIQSPVAYFSFEDEADTMRYRLRRIVEQYGLDGATVASSLNLFDLSQAEAPLAVELNNMGVRQLASTATMGQIEAAAKGSGLIVIDGVSDAFDGNENERRQVRRFVRWLANIARGHDAGLVLLAHIDKAAAKGFGAGNNYSGSTAWHNSVRSRLALTKETDGPIVLEHEKANFGALAESVRLVFTEHGVLVPMDAHAKTGTSETQSADDDAVLAAIRYGIGAGMTVPAATSGSGTTWHALSPMPELPPELQAKAGKARVLASAARLERSGCITRETYQDSYRNKRQRWALTQNASVAASESAFALPPIPPVRTNARAVGALVHSDALVQHQRSTNALTRTVDDGSLVI